MWSILPSSVSRYRSILSKLLNSSIDSLRSLPLSIRYFLRQNSCGESCCLRRILSQRFSKYLFRDISASRSAKQIWQVHLSLVSSTANAHMFSSIRSFSISDSGFAMILSLRRIWLRNSVITSSLYSITLVLFLLYSNVPIFMLSERRLITPIDGTFLRTIFSTSSTADNWVYTYWHIFHGRGNSYFTT